jgi:hypothetical protein
VDDKVHAAILLNPKSDLGVTSIIAEVHIQYGG